MTSQAVISYLWRNNLREFFTSFVLLAFAFTIQAQHFGTGLEFNEALYQTTPLKASLTRGDYSGLPSSASLKQFVPSPGNQLKLNTSVGWAVSYYAHTILEARLNGITDPKIIRSQAYSPIYTYHHAKVDNEKECFGQADLSQAFWTIKNQGSPRFTDFLTFCTDEIPEQVHLNASKNTISSFSRIFNPLDAPDLKITALKKALAEGFPVVIGMYTPPSFESAKEFWQPRERFDTKYPGHALCVIGYDDKKYGGSFEVVNSWGKSWGNEGFLWIPYNSLQEFAPYAFELYDVPEHKKVDLSGEIILRMNNGSIVPVSHKSGGYYTLSSPLRSGDLFQFIISNNETAFVYALGTDLSNKFSQLFPHDELISPVLPYKSNHIVFPDEENYVVLDQNPGKDFLCVLYSREELNIDKIRTQLETASGSVYDRFKSTMAESLIDPESIDFGKERISFSGFTNGKSVILLMVEIDHK